MASRTIVLKLSRPMRRRLERLSAKTTNKIVFRRCQMVLKLARGEPPEQVLDYHAHDPVKIVLVLDNFRIHQAPAVKAMLAKFSQFIRLYFLPTYSPELNPIERVWRHLRRNVTDTMFFKTMRRLLKGVAAFLTELATQPDIVLSMIFAVLFSVQGDVERLEKELENVMTERLWVITQARKGRLTENDLDTQLAALSLQESGLKRELAACQQTIDLNAIEGWQEKVAEYLADLKAGLEWLDAPPQNDEEALRQFEEKRRIVRTLVERVNKDKERHLEIVFRLDVLSAINQLADFRQTKLDEIYSRIHWFTNLRRLLIAL